MTLPEQSERAVAQTRQFLVRLTSPYVEGGIKGIRREVRDEASRLLRHYPLSWNSHCPAPDNAANADTVGSKLARRITGLQPMLEYREQIAILKSDNNRRADLEVGLREGVETLQAEVRRLEDVIAAREPTLTDAEREAIEHFAHANWAMSPVLRGLLERLGGGR